MADKKFEKEVGFIVNAKGYLLSLDGLPSVRINDILINEQNGGKAIVISLDGDHVTALLLNDVFPKAGDQFTRSEENLEFSLGEHLYGRIINVFGDPIDGKGSFPKKNTSLQFETVAPGVSGRKEIDEHSRCG